MLLVISLKVLVICLLCKFEIGFRFGHLNARSLVPKSLQMYDLIIQENLDFMCISETWARSMTDECLFASCPADYKFVSRSRSRQRGGELLLSIEAKLKYISCFSSDCLNSNVYPSTSDIVDVVLSSCEFTNRHVTTTFVQ